MRVGDSHISLDSKHPSLPKFPQCQRGTDDFWKSLRSASSSIWMSGENIDALRPPLTVWIPAGALVTPKEANPSFASEGLKMKGGLSVVLAVAQGAWEGAELHILHFIHSFAHLPQQGS